MTTKPKPLCIPEGAIRQHFVVLGKTGSGKSSALRHVVEHLLGQQRRVCIMDPKGDWHGLKVDADGKSPGFSIIGFGDFKEPRAQDVPINRHSGKHVAELIATGNRPCVIGFRGWMHADMVHFWIDFASTLFNRNAGELYLFVDEVHNFAPKGRVMDPEAGKSLHYTNRLMSEGRGLGIVCGIASQRPQKVHNDTLTCCETLVAMRVVHEADRQALKDWIDGCGNGTAGNELLHNVASLERGEAFVWSPEIGFGPKRVRFPMFTTLDSFAPPQLQTKVSDSGWADVDLGAVKEKLAAVIEEAKANDPAELKRTIADLKRQVAAKPTAASAQPVETKVPVFEADDRRMLVNLSENVSHQIGLLKTIETSLGLNQNQIRTLLARVESIEKPVCVITPQTRMIRMESHPTAKIPTGHTIIDGTTGLTGTQQKILDTIAMLSVRGIQPNRESVARWLDIHPNGGRYGSDLAALRAQDWIRGFELTTKGRANSGIVRTGYDAAMAPLDGTQRTILEALRDGARHSRETLAEALGIHPNGGRFGSDLARLRTMGLIPERGEIYLLPCAYA